MAKDQPILSYLHTFTLVVLGVAQPLFDLLSRDVEFLVVRESRPSDVIAFVLILCVLLPGILVLFEVLAALIGQRVRTAIHALFLVILLTLIALPVWNKFVQLPGTVSIAAVLSLSAVITIGYLRFRQLRTFFTFLSPALLLVPCLFLFHPSVRKVLS